MKYEITPEKRQELTGLALMMPEFSRKNNLGQPLEKTIFKFIKGKNLTEDLKKQIKGKIDLNGRYKVGFTKPLLVNHHQNIFKIFEQEGQTGVDIYVKFFKDEFEAAKIKAAELDAEAAKKKADETQEVNTLKIVKWK